MCGKIETAKQSNVQCAKVEHMLNWKTCSTSGHMLKCKHTHVHVHLHVHVYIYAQLKACICSTESMHMLNWKHAQPPLKAGICSTESMHMLNWKHAYAQLKHAYAQLKAYTFSILKVSTGSTETVHMLNWLWKHAHAPPLKVFIWSMKIPQCRQPSVHMIYCKCPKAQFKPGTCSTASIHLCAYAQLKVCTCSTETVHMLNLK